MTLSYFNPNQSKQNSEVSPVRNNANSSVLSFTPIHKQKQFKFHEHDSLTVLSRHRRPVEK